MSVRFTVIIIHRNGFDRLKAAIDSIKRASSTSEEIFIVDNASSDDSIDRISSFYPDVNVILNEFNSGYGHAANQGIKKGTGDYFLICNNDIVVPKNIFDELESVFKKDANAGIVSGQQTNINGERIRTSSSRPSLISDFDGIGRVSHSKDPKTISQVGIIRGACLGVRRKMIDDIGAYDEDFFFYFEDTEWCIRAWRNDWKVILNPEIEIVHLGGSSSSEFYKESRIEFYRSRMIFWKKIYPLHITILLHLWNIPKLFMDLIFYFILTMLSFGLNKRLKNKMTDRLIVIAWLINGKPSKWGLPNKKIN